MLNCALTVPSKLPSCLIIAPELLITVTPVNPLLVFDPKDSTEALSSPLLIVASLIKVTLLPPSPIVCWSVVSLFIVKSDVCVSSPAKEC